MREFGWAEEKILNGGYYKAHRYWSVLREIKANDLHDQTVAHMAPHLTPEGQKEIFDSLQARQPRRHPPIDDKMPDEIAKKFEKHWNEIDRKQKHAGSKSKASRRN